MGPHVRYVTSSGSVYVVDYELYRYVKTRPDAKNRQVFEESGDLAETGAAPYWKDPFFEDIPGWNPVAHFRDFGRPGLPEVGESLFLLCRDGVWVLTTAVTEVEDIS